MRSRACLVVVAAASLWLAAPARADDLPPALGPRATIADSAGGGGMGGGTFFVLAEVDGKPVPNSIDASQRASRGLGANLRIVREERTVPAGRIKLKLVARNAQAAPIGELFAALRNDAVEGVIEVELRPDTRYLVTGMLDPFRREVWLEEESSKRLVGEKIVQAASAAARAQTAEAGTFTCCNLHYDDNWIGDANYTALPFVPAGSRVRFVDWGRFRANVLIEGRKMSIGIDFARDQMTREQFAQKVIVDASPSARIAGYPAEIQAAVRAGKVVPGMTREQVIVSLGFPRADVTRNLDAMEWTYWASEHDEYSVLWSDDGRVKSVEAAMRIKRMVLMPSP